MIQFRVEVIWDGNAVARSYDAFVDPPAYQGKTNNIDAVTGGQSTLAREAGEPLLPAEQLSPIVFADPTSNRDRAEAVPPGEVIIEEPLAGDAIVEVGELRREYGPTIDGNSIWRVARAVASDAIDLTIYQWMYAIWQANPQAFMGTNMHRLNMGAVLTMPLADEVRELPHAEAWRAYSSQLALLQQADPVTQESAQQAAVAAEAELDPGSAEASSTLVTEAPVDKLAQIDEPVAASPVEISFADESAAVTASEDALIALLEESASIMDARAIVNAHKAGTLQPALPEATMVAEAAGVDEAINLPVPATTGFTHVVASTRPSILTGEVVLDDIDPADTKQIVAVDQASQGFTAPAVVDSANLPTHMTNETSVADWHDSLQSRHRFVETMPVIGAAGSLAFVGRVLQRTDAFVATSPSWAALAFGAWVTLMIVMLRNELVARRRRLPAIAGEMVVDATDGTRAESTDQKPVSIPSPAVSRGPDDEGKIKVESKRRSRQLTSQPPSESNAQAIIMQADSILAGGDSEEAIKLMKLAVELQPNQPMLINRLLELYHQTRRAAAFEKLINDSLVVLKNLDADDLAQLRVMHSRLLPGTIFPLADVLAVDVESASEQDLLEAVFTDQAWPVNDSDIDELAQSSASQEVDMSLFVAPCTVAGNITVDEESDRNVMAVSISEDFSNRFEAFDENTALPLDDDAFIETQVIFTGKGVPLREEAVEQQSMVGEILDLAVTLKEADVYLAYGLYDNAEELLLKGMEVDPDRADFLARLLDAYYATRNVVDFISCAEVMLDMGDAGREHWDKVEIMGYELAPYNKMFAGGKNRCLSAVELDIPKPETADFDFSDIEEDREDMSVNFEIDRNEKTEALSTDLNLDLASSDNEDTADELDQILGLDTSDTPALPLTRQHCDDDDISIFVVDDDEEVDVGAGEGEHIQSLKTSEILAIPESSDNSIHQDDPSFDPDSTNELDDSTAKADKLLSLKTSDILAIPETSVQLDDENSEAFEIDEDALAMDLDTVGEELELDLEGENADDGGDLAPKFDDEEVMEFTIEDTQLGLATRSDTGETSLSIVESPSEEALTDASGEKVDGRILYFPDNNNEGRDISEFESEVKVTLQAIRDQLQHVTERLFRQERETSDLQQAIAELSKDDVATTDRENKK